MSPAFSYRAKLGYECDFLDISFLLMPPCKCPIITSTRSMLLNFFWAIFEPLLTLKMWFLCFFDWVHLDTILFTTFSHALPATFSLSQSVPIPITLTTTVHLLFQRWFAIYLDHDSKTWHCEELMVQNLFFK